MSALVRYPTAFYSQKQTTALTTVGHTVAHLLPFPCSGVKPRPGTVTTMPRLYLRVQFHTTGRNIQRASLESNSRTDLTNDDDLLVQRSVIFVIMNTNTRTPEQTTALPGPAASRSVADDRLRTAARIQTRIPRFWNPELDGNMTGLLHC